MDGALLKRLDSAVMSLEKVVIVFLVTCMFVLGMAQVVSRFVIKSPIPWTESMLTYMFIWSSYLGASVAVAKNSHFMVDIFVNYLPAKYRRYIEVLVNLLIIFFAVFIVYKGMYLVIENRTQLMSAMPFSMSWPYLALPVSSLFMIIHTITRIYNLIVGRE